MRPPDSVLWALNSGIQASQALKNRVQLCVAQEAKSFQDERRTQNENLRQLDHRFLWRGGILAVRRLANVRSVNGNETSTISQRL